LEIKIDNFSTSGKFMGFLADSKSIISGFCPYSHLLLEREKQHQNLGIYKTKFNAFCLPTFEKQDNSQFRGNEKKVKWKLIMYKFVFLFL